MADEHKPNRGETGNIMVNANSVLDLQGGETDDAQSHPSACVVSVLSVTLEV
jgi:hypothetical protein